MTGDRGVPDVGTVAGTQGGAPVPLGGRRPRLVLAALLLEPGRVVPVDRLAEAVWDDAPPASARTQVAIAVSGLRRALREAGGDEGVIETVRPGYRLRVPAARLDARAAEAGLRAARTVAANGHGGPLPGGAGPVAGAGAGVPGQRDGRGRGVALDGAAVTGALMALLAENPLRDRPRALLMTALHRSGRQAEALEVYREGRRVLDEELGLEPGRALRELHGAILRDDPALSAPRRGNGSPGSRS